jgi:hypothetical protein
LLYIPATDSYLIAESLSRLIGSSFLLGSSI